MMCHSSYCAGLSKHLEAQVSIPAVLNIISNTATDITAAMREGGRIRFVRNHSLPSALVRYAIAAHPIY